MHHRERAQLVARLNLNWPGQQISKPTADEWFGPLQAFPASEVWDAVDRHRRTITPGRDGRPVGHWRPELADLLAAIDANWRERSAERRQLLARAARAARVRSKSAPQIDFRGALFRHCGCERPSAPAPRSRRDP